LFSPDDTARMPDPIRQAYLLFSALPAIGKQRETSGAAFRRTANRNQQRRILP
jgi:hypothetical protein